ncbi:DNA-processing protein DprA [Vulgatibacter sp.]|uniref:DNA-processing protein DprA n=1 Tax=Vulgatibacter sp. TaxID=1971226 RepID=UPI0035620DA2
MESERERALRIALWMVRGISAQAIDRIAGQDFVGTCLGDRRALAEAMALREGGREALLAAPPDLAAWAAAQEAALRSRGGRFVLRGEAGYPHLGTLDDRPEVLSVRGDLCGAGGGALPRAVAVIGSRRADPGTVGLARRFGAALARAGFTVVSGGALGIDAAAHEGALEAGGETVAVLGSGLLRPTPARNRGLFARILAAGGGLCSELPPGEGAMKWHFPRRNRLVAALARAVVVVRAAAGSGCFHTVDAAHRLGRQVIAVPAPAVGARNAYGEALLRGEGDRPPASPAGDVDELLALFGRQRERPVAAGLEPEEQQVLSALGEAPAPLGAIAAAVGIEAGVAARILARLCARGLARAAGPGRFAA